MNHRQLLLPLVVLLLAGCEDTRSEPVMTTPEGDSPVVQERSAVDQLVAQLASGRDPTDAKASKRYDEAVSTLIGRGSAIEPQLIDHLRRAQDWSIRLGLIEVLQATGSKACIEHLIVMLDDEQPLVAHRANATLEEFCQHQEIPRTAKSGPLAPVPKPTDLALDAEERVWAAWHGEYKHALKIAWQSWWDANRDQVEIK